MAMLVTAVICINLGDVTSQAKIRWILWQIRFTERQLSKNRRQRNNMCSL